MEYKEYLVKRNKNGKEKFLTALLYLAATVLPFILFRNKEIYAFTPFPFF